MNARVLAQTLLRVWGLILIITALSSVGTFAMLFKRSGDSDAALWQMATVSSCVHLVMSFVAGVLLVRNGDRVGAWLVSDIAIEGEAADSHQIQVIGFAILGLYFLVAGLRDVAAIVVTVLSKAKWDETHQFDYLWDRQQQALVGGVVNTIAGLLLLFRREGIARASSATWRAIRGRESS